LSISHKISDFGCLGLIEKCAFLLRNTLYFLKTPVFGLFF
jgi:hypothetical protein